MVLNSIHIDTSCNMKCNIDCYEQQNKRCDQIMLLIFISFTFVFVGECVVIVHTESIAWLLCASVTGHSDQILQRKPDLLRSQHIICKYLVKHSQCHYNTWLAGTTIFLNDTVIVVTMDNQWSTQSSVLLNPLHSFAFYICLTPYLFEASSKLPCTFNILLILLVYPCMTAICSGELSSLSLQQKILSI